MTINGTNIDQYLLQPIDTGFEYRTGGEGITANGTHYQNIIAKKEILTLKFRPLKPSELTTIRNVFYSTDEYLINGKNYYRNVEFKGTNVGDMFTKGITIQLKEI